MQVGLFPCYWYILNVHILCPWGFFLTHQYIYVYILLLSGNSLSYKSTCILYLLFHMKHLLQFSTWSAYSWPICPLGHKGRWGNSFLHFFMPNNLLFSLIWFVGSSFALMFYCPPNIAQSNSIYLHRQFENANIWKIQPKSEIFYTSTARDACYI